MELIGLMAVKYSNLNMVSCIIKIWAKSRWNSTEFQVDEAIFLFILQNDYKASLYVRRDIYSKTIGAHSFMKPLDVISLSHHPYLK